MGVRVLVAASALAHAVSAAAGAQAVRVRVTDDIDEAPVPAALVTVLADRTLSRADAEGKIILQVRHAGLNVFTFRHIGFEPVTTTLDVPEHDTLKVHVIMHHAAQLLDTVSVSARETMFGAPISAFDRQRLSSPGGHFITLADIERRKPFETLDLFTNVGGIRVMRPLGKDPAIVMTRGGVGLNGTGFSSGGGCPLRLGLDGVVYDNGFDVNFVSPRDIYGIEIYQGPATIPVKYMSASVDNGTCGLVMIWTFGGAQGSQGGGAATKPPTDP